MRKADSMRTTQQPSTASPMDALYQELTLLESRYADFVAQETVQGDLYALKRSIEGYFQGDPEATSYLSEHGIQLLEDIKEKLSAAIGDQLRLNEESPSVAANSTGDKAHQLSQATALVVDAEEKLKTGLKADQKH